MKSNNGPWRWRMAGAKESCREQEMEDEELLRQLRAADPGADEELRDWANSEAGRRVYERILARTEEPVRRPARKSRATRVALVAGAAAVVAGAAAGGMVYGLRGEPHLAVTSTVIAAEAADRADVLAQLVAMDAQTQSPGNVQREQPGQTQNAGAILAQAQALGIIGQGDASWVAERGSLTRATYSLWVSRALGDRLQAVHPVMFSDLGGLSDEVRQAVLRVAGAGVLEGGGDGRFEPNRPLTRQEAEKSLELLEQRLGLRPE